MSQIEIENLLYKAMGLDSTSIGSSAIERAVEKRMASVGVASVENYWQHLKISSGEVQELIEAVVVPETSFFRHAEAFNALTRFVFEEWLPKHRQGPLRILSVPCSTGEEPYSIVMALLDGGLSPSRFRVEAWDISRRALSVAQAATYGKNSFRSQDLSYRDRYFESVERGFKVLETVKRNVDFRQCNLLAPESCAGAERFDVVFCRNVLIYFDRPTQEQAIKNLDQLLAPDGMMLVGPAEALLMRGAGFMPTNAAMSFAFRRGGAKHVGAYVPPPIKPLPKLPVKPVAQVVQKLAAPKPLTPVPASAPASKKDELETVRHLADAGRTAEALAACEAFLRDKKDSAEGYYLLGIISDASGNVARATESYRKTVYLDPNHSEALVHLALLAERRGDANEAKRLHERAKRIAAR